MYVDMLTPLWDIPERAQGCKEPVHERAAVTISLHERGVHMIQEIVRYVYADEFEHLDQPKCNLSLHSCGHEETFCGGVAFLLLPQSNYTTICE